MHERSLAALKPTQICKNQTAKLLANVGVRRGDKAGKFEKVFEWDQNLESTKENQAERGTDRYGKEGQLVSD